MSYIIQAKAFMGLGENKKALNAANMGLAIPGDTLLVNQRQLERCRQEASDRFPVRRIQPKRKAKAPPSPSTRLLKTPKKDSEI